MPRGKPGYSFVLKYQRLHDSSATGNQICKTLGLNSTYRLGWPSQCYIYNSECRTPVFFNRGSTETDRNCRGWNSQPQFYPVTAM